MRTQEIFANRVLNRIPALKNISFIKDLARTYLNYLSINSEEVLIKKNCKFKHEILDLFNAVYKDLKYVNVFKDKWRDRWIMESLNILYDAKPIEIRSLKQDRIRKNIKERELQEWLQAIFSVRLELCDDAIADLEYKLPTQPNNFSTAKILMAGYLRERHIVYTKVVEKLLEQAEVFKQEYLAS